MRPPFDLIRRLRRRFRLEFSDEGPGDADRFYVGDIGNQPRDRTPAGFREVIEKSMQLWREDALARRIVSLTTQFSVGRGFRITSDDPGADAVLREFWEHPLNRMDARITEWSDELCRTGNLFIMISSDVSGMSYVRAIPAAQIGEIVSMDNDIEQPLSFRFREVRPAGDFARIPEEICVPAASLSEQTLDERMLHFTINRPIGGQWGEPDLAPILKWLIRYDTWLEDRSRLNHYRTTFLYVVKTSRMNEPQRAQLQDHLNIKPPSPGMILVTDESQEWTILRPELDSSDANEDGMALKKMIAAGAGIPVGFLAENNGGSKAETGGIEDSACRNFRQRQQTLMFITETLLRYVLVRAALRRRDLDPSAEIHVYGDDIAAPGMNEGGIVRGV